MSPGAAPSLRSIILLGAGLSLAALLLLRPRPADDAPARPAAARSVPTPAYDPSAAWEELARVQSRFRLLRCEPARPHPRCLLADRRTGQQHWTLQGRTLPGTPVSAARVAADSIELVFASERAVLRIAKSAAPAAATRKVSPRVEPLASKARLETSPALRGRIKELRSSQWRAVPDQGLQLVSRGRGKLGRILQPGDIVHSANGEPVRGVEDLLTAARQTGVLLLRLRRGKRSFGLSVRLVE